jgi:excisionase family DNA binding protein
MSGNPFLLGEAGPSAILPPRVCRLLEVRFSAELARLRTDARGVDQETAFALMAVRAASAAFVPLEEQVVAGKPEQRPRSEWLSTGQAAELLGLKGSRGVVQAISRETLPAVKVGDRWRLNRADVERYRVERTEQRWRR